MTNMSRTINSWSTNIKTNLVFFDKTGSTKKIWYGEVKGKFTKKKSIRDEHFEDIFKKWAKREVSEISWIIPVEKIKENNYDLSPKNPNEGDNDILLPPDKILKGIENEQRKIDKVISSLKNILKK